MNLARKTSVGLIVFSKWSRKSYALFAALKKLVKIAHLSVDICVASFHKIDSLITHALRIIFGNEEELYGDELELLPVDLLLIKSFQEQTLSLDNYRFFILFDRYNNIQSPLNGKTANNGLF